MNLNNKAKFYKLDDNTKERDLYHIGCDPDLGPGKYAVRWIPCAWLSWQNSLQQLLQANVDADKKPLYSCHVVDCRYDSILGAYNKWYIVFVVVCDIVLNEIDVAYIEELQETIIGGIAYVFSEQIGMVVYGAFQTYYVSLYGYYIVQWKSIPYL